MDCGKTINIFSVGRFVASQRYSEINFIYKVMQYIILIRNRLKLHICVFLESTFNSKLYIVGFYY